jgi:hypothetical protein
MVSDCYDARPVCCAFSHDCRKIYALSPCISSVLVAVLCDFRTEAMRRLFYKCVRPSFVLLACNGCVCLAPFSRCDFPRTRTLLSPVRASQARRLRKGIQNWRDPGKVRDFSEGTAGLFAGQCRLCHRTCLSSRFRGLSPLGTAFSRRFHVVNHACIVLNGLQGQFCDGEEGNMPF